MEGSTGGKGRWDQSQMGATLEGIRSSVGEQRLKSQMCNGGQSWRLQIWDYGQCEGVQSGGHDGSVLLEYSGFILRLGTDLISAWGSWYYNSVLSIFFVL